MGFGVRVRKTGAKSFVLMYRRGGKQRKHTMGKPSVGYGVKERLSWALALPLVLFTLDVTTLLFGVGPRERAGFYDPVPMDFLLYLLRLVIWALIWPLRDELA